jgi:hypothetical protein
MNGSSNLPVLGVKGQDERPLRGALDSPVRHHRTSMLTSENKLRRAATSAVEARPTRL